MTEPVTLYTLADVARVLGITPQALSNRRARGAPTVPVKLPEPGYRTRSGRPLYTRTQVETLLAERIAAAQSALDTPDDSVYP